eukprot:jgi/Pico_ML_1/50631/g1810.t3
MPRRGASGKQVTVMGNPGAGGPFAPIVVLTRNVMGKKEFNQFRGKAIAMHSQVIKSFCKEIGADTKQVQGLIRLAKKNGEKLGFLEGPRAARRTWLASVCGLVASAFGGQCAQASRARSVRSEQATPLKLVNASEESLLVFWINYDGDAELMTVMDAGETWTADSYESHAWRVIGAEDKLLYAEFVMGDEAKVVEVIKQDGKQVQGAPEAIPFDGFDGLGGKQEGYHAAEVGAVAATEQGPIAIIAIEGSDVPLPILLGPVEGTSLALSALGISSRRPRTMETWSRSLKEGGVRVERALITRLWKMVCPSMSQSR